MKRIRLRKPQHSCVAFSRDVSHIWVFLTLLLACSFGSAASSATGLPESPVTESNTSISAPRPNAGQSATLLPDGHWLLIGGRDATGHITSQLALFDPNSEKSEKVGVNLITGRTDHSATVLPDGSVLIVGGVDVNGRVLHETERYFPQLQEIRAVDDISLLARTQHTSTLMMDGRLLIVGGKGASNQVLRDTELLNTKSWKVERLGGELINERFNHLAALLPSDYVMVSRGLHHSNQPLESSEFYDRTLNKFLSNYEFALPPVPLTPYSEIQPAVLAMLPRVDSTNVAVDAYISVRFSKPLQPGTLNDQSVFLIGDEGAVETTVTAAESGLLLFVIPKKELMPASRYTLFIQGAQDENHRALPFSALSFQTARLVPVSNMTGNPAEHAPLREESDDESWIPKAGNFSGDWRSGNAKLAARTWPKRADLLRSIHGISVPLKGVATADKTIGTALTGQVLRLNGLPLVNVTLSIGAERVSTDSNGEFVLTQIPSGTQELVIDGSSANRGRHQYGRYAYRAEIKADQINALPFVIWMTALDVKEAARIASPTLREEVITNPKVPGLELRIPQGTVIRDAAGRILTEVNVTAIPVDQPPFPLPHLRVPVYFTIQPGGAHLQALSAQASHGARLIYPNFSGAAPGTRFDFWNYDSRVKGWYVYGQGYVSADGKQIMPDRGVVIYEFSGAMVALPSNAPEEGPIPENPQCGDPVDCYSGIFIHDSVDLSLEGAYPLEVRRVYRTRDTISRAFGVGANLSYDIFLVGDTWPYTYQDLILPDGGRVHYVRTSPGEGYEDAVYTATTPGKYFGTTINFGYYGWALHLKNGAVYWFPDYEGGDVARCAALIRIEDRYGQSINMTRGANCNLVSISTPGGRYLAFAYDALDRIVGANDNTGRTVTYQYDVAGNLSSFTDVVGNVEYYTYDAANRMLTVVDKRGNTMVSNQYDANGRVSQQTYADSSTSLWAYTLDAENKVIQTDYTNGRGAVTRFLFNAAGYPTSIVRAHGQPEQQTTTLARDPATNLVQSKIDALGRITGYQYDTRGNRIRLTLLKGTGNEVSWNFAFDVASGEPSSITDPLSRTTLYHHDSLGRLTQIQDALNNTIEFTYNSSGQALSSTRHVTGSTLVANYSYVNDELATATDPLSRTSKFFSDAVGRLQSYTNAAGSTYSVNYDKLSRVVQTIDPDGGTTQIGYDANNNVTSFTDANNHTTTFTYDSRNRLISKTDPLSHTELYSYDAVGNLVRVTDREGRVRGYSYDYLNRVTSAGFGATTASPTAYVSTIGYSWDSGNRVTGVTDSVSGSITHNFDGLDRLVQEQSPQGTINYTYYSNNLRQSVTVQGQSVVNYSYDDANRLTQISQGSANVGFTYDGANRRTALVLPSGVQAIYDYDNASQLTSLSYQKSGGSLGTLTYAYDLGGHRTTAGGSLADVSLPASAVGTHNANNQLNNWDGQTMGYDANGALTSSNTIGYEWDERGRLAAIKNGGQVVASFGYDAFNRRISKSIGGTTKNFLHDGWQIVQELTATTPTANLLTGPGLDQIFRRTEGSTINDYLTDALGSTIALTDASGAIQTNYGYDAYGQASTTGAASNNAFQYTGRENDGNGLYYYRNRYYHSAVGRFISEDPIGFQGGQNIYAYVEGNPISNIDPLGLVCTTDRFGTTQCSTAEEHGYGPGYSNNGDNSVYPATANNARYNSCYSSCMAKEVGDDTSVVCSVVGSGVGSRAGAVAGEVTTAGCQVVSQHAQCQRECTENESCPK